MPLLWVRNIQQAFKVGSPQVNPYFLKRNPLVRICIPRGLPNNLKSFCLSLPTGDNVPIPVLRLRFVQAQCLIS